MASKEVERTLQILIAGFIFGLCLFIENRAQFASHLFGRKSAPDSSEILKTAAPNALQFMEYLTKHITDTAMDKTSKELNNKKLINHSKCTKFLHPSLELKYVNDDKGYGIVTTSKIAFGSIISVETPMMMLEDSPAFYNDFEKEKIDLPTIMHGTSVAIQNTIKVDAEFKRIWNDELETNPDMLIKYENTMKLHQIPLSTHTNVADWLKFLTNWHGSMNGRKPFAIYNTLSRVNHGLPQNSAMIFGGDKDDYVCILIATKTLQKGEEIVLDYFGNLHMKEALESHKLNARRFRGQEVGFAADSMLPITQSLVSPDVSKEDKRRILRDELYSNGIIGKPLNKEYKALDGCIGLSVDECIRKRDMRRSIVSGDIFAVIKRQKNAENWTGNEFIQRFVNWTNKQKNVCIQQ